MPCGAAVLGAAALLLAAGPPAAADEPADCLACHGERVDAERFAASPHAALSCGACHASITSYPHPEAPSPPNCAACHEQVVAAHRASVHAPPAASGSAPAGCAACHGDVHAALPHTAPRSLVHRTRLAATCARCHAAEVPPGKARIPVVRPVDAYLKSVHAGAVAAGKAGATCADCHGAHDILAAGDPGSRLGPGKIEATCGQCHAEELRAYRGSVHAEAVHRGARDAPGCTDCHGEHLIIARTEAASPVFAANIPRETCGRCHESIRLSAKYGLPQGQVASFRDSYHGLALRSGRLTAANCASCHGAHDVRPATDPRSSVHAANLAETCGKCHPGVGTRVTLGSVHALPDTGTARAVAWVRFAYIWLISAVVGGMALHNILDLLRKARRPHLPPALVERPERMPRVLRWQHGLVMLSFPALVYSGFALTYPESWWAAPLLAWETELGLRGLVHRAAAVVLLGSLAWHAGLLLTRPRLRACFRGLRWSRGDVSRLAAAVAYYLGRRPTPPSGDTFTYVEKAEYWAFLWGTVLMALTGVVLWFENVSLRWLPKWALDVATAVHFWEAVLATLAIVVWHLYWVMFDPDVYPMDMAWWHGRPPVSRVLERHADAAEERADEA